MKGLVKTAISGHTIHAIKLKIQLLRFSESILRSTEKLPEHLRRLPEWKKISGDVCSRHFFKLAYKSGRH